MSQFPLARPRQGETNPAGYTPAADPPHGTLHGLRGRLAGWADRMGRDRTLPWAGLGIVKDLEVVVQLLNLREFAEWLRVNGSPDHWQFADDILANEETLDAFGVALGHGKGGPSGKDPVREVEDLVETESAHEALAKAIEEASDAEFEDSTQGRVAAVKTLAAEAREAARLREVLVEMGVLDVGDTTTDTAALLRALLA